MSPTLSGQVAYLHLTRCPYTLHARAMTTTATKQSRYIGKCKRCAKVHSFVDTAKADRFGFHPWDRNCTCGKIVRFKAVRGHYSAKVACNAKCLHAASADCTCSCGGLNHAADYQGR